MPQPYRVQNSVRAYLLGLMTYTSGCTSGEIDGPLLMIVHAYEGWACEGYDGAESSGNCWRELAVSRSGTRLLTCGLYEDCTLARTTARCEPGPWKCCRDDVDDCTPNQSLKADVDLFMLGDNEGLEAFSITESEFQAVEQAASSMAFLAAFDLDEHEACAEGYTDSTLRYTLMWSDGTRRSYRTAGKCLSDPEHPFSKLMDQLSMLRTQFVVCDPQDQSTDFNAVRGACIPCDGAC